MSSCKIDKTKYVGERYESKNGKYEIIEYLGGGHSKVKVKFDMTGSEVICRYDTAYKGFTLDPEYVNYLYVGKTYDTCCGPVTILKDLGYRKEKKCVFVKIRFELTGFECEERLKNILSGYANDPGYFLYTMKDKIFHSNDYGDYKIIDESGQDAHGQKVVRVKFIATGYEYDVRYDAAKCGKVKDPMYFMYKVKDKIFHSNNYGDFKIIEYIGLTEDKKHRIVKIQFENTKSKKIVKYDDVLNGEVKDDAFHNADVAREILGNEPIKEDQLDRLLKRIWRLMMRRCYDTESLEYKSYGAKGVTVAPEWHNYNIFKRDVINIPGWNFKFNDPLNYQLDKDLLQYNIPHSMRIYSKNTCVWLNKSINKSIIGCNQSVYIYYNSIYEINDLYYLKTLPDNMPNYGPFDSLESAINMANYCYSSVGLYQLIIPTTNTMTLQQIFNHTQDRKTMVTIVHK